MKILITGGCGFVGSNLALFLKKKGFKFIFWWDNSYKNLFKRLFRFLNNFFCPSNIC